MMRVRSTLFVLLFVLLGARAHAATTAATLLVDADNDSATGCEAAGGVRGIELAFVTNLDVASQTITSLQRRDCAAGVLGAPLRLSGPWAAPHAGNVTHIELVIPFSELPQRTLATPMRLSFTFSSDSGETTAITGMPNGAPILHPKSSGVRRRAASPADGTQHIVIDGEMTDWARLTPLVDRGLNSVFMHGGRTELFLRFDLRDQSQPPVAANDAYAVRQGKSLVVDAPGVLENDTDAEGSDLSATLVAPAAHGSVTLSADGSFVYNNDGTLAGDGFDYKAGDGAADSNTARVTINVTPNAAPSAQNDTYATTRGGTLTVPAPGVLANDSDPEGDALTPAIAAPPARGTVSLSGDGSLTYTHNGSTEPSDTFTYTVSDGLANSAPASVTINVSSTNAPPVAFDDVFHVANGGTLDVAAPGLFSNDRYLDQSQSQWTTTVVTLPAHGTLTVSAGGAFIYVHDGSGASDSFAYRIDGGAAASNVATVTIVVGSANTPPVAFPDNYSTTEDAQLTVSAPGLLANDEDDGATLDAFQVTGTSHGTLTVQTNGSFTYTPNANFHGTDSFTYRVSDGDVFSSVVTATITVTSANDLPVAAADTAAVIEDAVPNTASGNVLANDSDLDADAVLTVTPVAANGTYGSIAIAANGAFTYTLDNSRPAVQALARDAAVTDVFNYVVADGQGGTATATLTVAITGVNDQPSFTSNVITAAPEDALYTYEVTTSDVDSGAARTITASALPAWLTFTDHGDGTATLSGTPDNVDVGSVPVTLTLSDTIASVAQPFTIVITNTNDAPVATNDAGAVTEDAIASTASGNVLANDSDQDAGDALSVAPIVNANGTYGSVTIAADGAFIYTLDNSFAAVQALAQHAVVTDLFHYTVIDGNGGTANATLTITITGANDAPSFTSTAVTSATEDVPYSYAIAVADVDTGATLTVTSSALPAWLTLSGNTLSGTPANAQVGNHTVTLTVSDGVAAAVEQTFTIIVANTNDAPVAQNDAGSITEDAATNTVTANVLANDADEDAGDTLTASPAGVQNGTFGSMTIAANGAYTYTLDNTRAAVQALTPSTPGTDTFTYTASDSNGGTDDATLIITITGINDAPAFTSSGVTNATEDATYTYNIAASDADAGAALVIAASTKPAWLTFTDHGNGTATLTGTPENAQVGNHTVTLTVSDGVAAAVEQTFTIIVANTNDAPVAQNDSGAVTEDVATNTVSANVLANDMDEDASDTLAASPAGVQNGTFGSMTIAANGDYTYTLDNTRAAVQALTPSTPGTDTFTYTASDSNGGTDDATLTITVTGVNDAPAFTSSGVTNATEDVTYTYSIAASDADAGATLVIAATTKPAWLTFTDHGNGTATLTGTPENAQVGNHTVTLTVSDGLAAPVEQTFTIIVANTNDAPVAQSDTGSITEDAATNTVSSNVLTNDTDEDASDTLTASPTGVQNGTFGSVTIAANGDYTYTLDNTRAAVQALTPAAPGTDTFTYTTSDSNGGTDDATLTITIAGINDAPAFTSSGLTNATEDATYTYSIATSDADAGATLVIAATSKPAWLTFTDNGNGTATLTGTPENTQVGNHTVTLTVSDGVAGAVEQTFTIIVANTNDAPVAQNDSGAVTEDVATNTVSANVLANDMDEDATDTLTASPTGVQNGTFGSVTIAANGEYTFTLDNTRAAVQALTPSTPGTDTFTYTASDSNGGTDDATLTITVTGINDAPTFTSNGLPNATEDVTYTYNIATSDADAGATLVIAASTKPAWLTFTDNSNGTATLTGTPENAQVGHHTVTLTVSDGVAAAVEQTFTIIVANTNDAPIAQNDTGAVTEDAATNTVSSNVLTNDTDEDASDTLTASPTGVQNGTFGSVTIAANGEYTYTLDNSRAAVQALTPSTPGTDTFTYTASDSNGGTDDATLTITVTGVNDAPAFTSSGVTNATEDTTYTYSIATSDADAGATLVIAASTKPAWLTFTDHGNGTATLTGTPTNAQVGNHTVTLTVSDGVAAAVEQTFTIAVANVNDAPSAAADTNAIAEDAAQLTVGANVLTNDVDDDGDALVVSSVAGAAANVGNAVTGTYGSVTIAANGAYTYTLNNAAAVVQALQQGQNVTDVFSYVARDAALTTSASTLTITITGVNDTPVAVNDSYAYPVSGTLAVGAPGVLGNDTDVEGTALTAELLSSPPAADGTLVFDPNGSFTFTKNAPAGLSTTFTYRVSDGIANSSTATVTIVFNAPPNAVADTFGVLEDSGATSVPAASGLLANDTDADGNTLTITSITHNATSHAPGASIAATRGTLVVNANGSFTYTPNANDFGAETFSYVVSDGTVTATGNVTITITPVNDRPGFTPGTATITINEDSGAYNQPWATSITKGPANESAQTLTFTAAPSNPALISGGTLNCVSVPDAGSPDGWSIDCTAASSGITVNPTTGNLSFTPSANKNGNLTVAVRLRDNGGTDNGGQDTYPVPPDVELVNVTINPVNDAPNFAFSQVSIQQREDQGTLSLPGFARTFSPGGGSDEAGQTLLQYSIRAQDPAFFSTLTIHPTTGDLTMIPALNAYGLTTIYVKAQDSGGTANSGVDFVEKSYSVTYLPVNDPPIVTLGANPWAAGVVTQQVLTNWGSAVVGPPNEVVLPAQPAGGTAQTISAWLVTVPNAAHQALFNGSAGLPTIDTSGTLRFTPAAGANGNATISVQVRDSGANNLQGCCQNVNTSSAQTFTISIGAANSPPSFNIAGNQSVAEETPAQTVTNFVTAVTPGANASDVGQTVSFTIGNNNSALFDVAPALVANGANYNLTYTPKPNTIGTATVTITATDNGSNVAPNVNSFARQFTITITNVNDAPSFAILTPGQNSYNDSGPQSVASFASSINKGAPHETSDALTFVIANNSNPALFSAGPAISATGTLTYTAAPGMTGTASISVALRDDGGTWANAADDLQSAPQPFTISVLQFSGNVNDQPTFTSGGNHTSLEDAGAQTVSPWATAISQGGDDSGQTLTFQITSNTNSTLFAAQPVISAAGVLTYTAVANANGSAQLTVVLKDNGGMAGGGNDTSAPVQFTISVTAVNDPPTFTGRNVYVASASGSPAAHTIASWATGVSVGPANENTQTLTRTVVVTAGASLFSVAPAVNATEQLTFTTAVGQAGTATINVTYTDNNATPANASDDASVTKSYTIGVGVNSPPTFSKGGPVTVNEDSGAQTFAGWATLISAGYPYETGQIVTFLVTTDRDAYFSVLPAIDSSGTLTFTPAADRFSPPAVNVTVVARDDGGTPADPADDLSSDPQTFTISLTNVNDPPTFVLAGNPPTVETGVSNSAYSVSNFATSISAGTFETGNVSFTLTKTSGSGSATLFSTAPAIAATSGATSTLSYTVAANQTGTATYEVRAVDSANLQSVGTSSFTITVLPVGGLSPVAPTRTYQTTAHMKLTIASSPNRLLDSVTDPTPSGTPLQVSSTFTNVDSGAAATLTDALTGTFTYKPRVGFTGTDTFNYSVCDGTPGAAGVKCGTGTITMNVVGPIIYYVNAAAAAGGDGSFDKPLPSFSGIYGPFTAATYVFVYSGTYSSGWNIPDNVTVVGQGAPAVAHATPLGTDFQSFFGITAPTGGTIGTLPDLNAGTAPVFNNSQFQITNNGGLRNVKIMNPGAGGWGLDLNPYVYAGKTILIDRVYYEGNPAVQSSVGTRGGGTITISSSALVNVYLAVYGGANGGTNFTFQNSRISGNTTSSTRNMIHIDGNVGSTVVFDANSQINIQRPLTAHDGSSNVTFHCPITITGDDASMSFYTYDPVNLPVAVTITGQVTIHRTGTTHGFPLYVSRTTFAMTNNNNVVTSPNHNATNFENMTAAGAGVKFQNMTASGAYFSNTSGGAITISNGTFSGCVTRVNAGNVVLGGGVTQGADCP